MENLLLDTMYDLPDLDDLEEVVVNKDTVEKGEAPVLVYSKDGKKKKKDKDKKSEAKETAAMPFFYACFLNLTFLL